MEWNVKGARGGEDRGEGGEDRRGGARGGEGRGEEGRGELILIWAKMIQSHSFAGSSFITELLKLMTTMYEVIFI